MIRCRCAQCVYKHLVKSTGYSDIKFVQNIAKYLKKKLLLQFKFKIKTRKKGKYHYYYTKTYKELEKITLNEYTYHLITCRQCGCIGKAYLSHRRLCINCHHINTRHEENTVKDWKSWAFMS